MELELVRFVPYDPEQSGFVPFVVLANAGASYEEVAHSYELILKDDTIFDEFKKEMYIIGRVPFHQEDAFTLGLKVGDIL